MDFDKTSIFGNDGNDLGIAMQWMGRSTDEVRQLYGLLVSPALPAAYGSLKALVRTVNVVIYTRRRQLVTYESVSQSRTVALTFHPSWHRDGQTYIPSTITTAEQIMAHYSGEPLDADEVNDVVKSLVRLLAARDAVAEALGLAAPPVVVVTSAAKDVDATAATLHSTLGYDVEHTYLFDDNANLANYPHVVLVSFPLLPLPPSLPFSDRHLFLNDLRFDHLLDHLFVLG